MIINGKNITSKGPNGFDIDGAHVTGAAKYNMLVSPMVFVSATIGGVSVTEDEWKAINAEYEAVRAQRRAPGQAPRKAAYANRYSSNARGYDGRGNRVNDGPEWTWGR